MRQRPRQRPQFVSPNGSLPRRQWRQRAEKSARACRQKIGARRRECSRRQKLRLPRSHVRGFPSR